MTKVYAANPNTYIPSPEATGAMRVEYTRNPIAFMLSQYVEYRKVTNDTGYYLNIDDEEAARIISSTADDIIWPDGNDAPSGNANKVGFEFLAFATKRYNIAFNIGRKAKDQAVWDILAMHARIYAQRMMTVRTVLALAKLTTAGNWGANTGDVDTNITGNTGKWDVSTSSRADIQRSIMWGLEKIELATLGAVSRNDVGIVMSPGCGRKVAASSEYKSWLERSPFAMDQVKGKTGRWSGYGLADQLFGVDVMIESTVKVTNKKGATRAASYALADSTPFLTKRPGSIEPAGEGPTFSPCTLFIYEDFTVEQKDDPDNRRSMGRIVDDIAVELTAPAAGFLFTDATS